MKTPFTDGYDRQFLIDTMMGPNAMRITEELAGELPITPGMRILDLGCGTGISSILLAEKYGATVFAADLWIPPTENAARFARAGLDTTIIPLFVDATKDIPFAHDYFDMIVSVDAYQYFGGNEAHAVETVAVREKRRRHRSGRPRIHRQLRRRQFAQGSRTLLGTGLVFSLVQLVESLVGKRTWHQNHLATRDGLLPEGVG